MSGRDRSTDSRAPAFANFPRGFVPQCEVSHTAALRLHRRNPIDGGPPRPPRSPGRRADASSESRVMMLRASTEGRLLGLDGTEWLMLLGGAMIAGFITLLF